MTGRRHLRRSLRLIFAAIALIGQSAIVSATAASDAAGAAAHVERSGIAIHHAHNEATCVVCRVLSLHRNAPAQPAAQMAPLAAPTARPSYPARRTQQTTLPSNLSRAPPGIA